ncbi:hypothetical protein CANINC_003563 [Pichia inconspicua]|uniref:Uncharacterized protein n=1 Tax=Pichia inconspicua TaxID=52247 RepID=A0A4T0WYD5_9ASCO|nr:hypothetical protein CANINC_003563 [[Candida] inconspicua]
MDSADRAVLALVHTSDRLLDDAHALLPAWQDQLTSQSKEDDGRLVLYNSYIKQALNCLFKALRQFSNTMDASIQASLYYKTAKILFLETASLNLASDYCYKGINLCKKYEPKLSMNKLRLLYLNFQIQFLANHTSADSLAYLNDIIDTEIPTDNNFVDIKYFFMFIKFTNFNSVFSMNKNLLNLKSILKSENIIFKQIVLFHLIEYQLTNNLPISEIKKNVQLLDDTLNDSSPLQFKALKILIDSQIALYIVDLENIVSKIQHLDTFIKTIKESKKSWQSYLNINFSIDSTRGSFPVQIKWISFKDFTITSYFYCSVLYSFKSWDKKNKSDKILKTLLPAISNNKKTSFTSLDELQKHLLKTEYLKILTDIYQLISDFVKDSVPLSQNSISKYSHLQTFIEQYTNNTIKYSTFEIIVYNTLIPIVKYLFAVIHQRNGNFYKALFLYSEVITFKPEQSAIISTLLSNFGIPITNNEQLKLISTLNSIPIVQNIIEQEKLNHSKISEFDLNYDQIMDKFGKLLKLKDKLLNRLNSAKVENNELTMVAIEAIKHFYQTSSTAFPFDSINLDLIQQKSPLLTSILYLIKGYTYKFDLGISTHENLNKKVSYFSYACMNSIKACNENNNNEIANLGYYEIYKIMNHNRNLYSTKDIEKVAAKLQIDSETNFSKRVKFS